VWRVIQYYFIEVKSKVEKVSRISAARKQW